MSFGPLRNDGDLGPDETNTTLASSSAGGMGSILKAGIVDFGDSGGKIGNVGERGVGGEGGTDRPCDLAEVDASCPCDLALNGRAPIDSRLRGDTDGWRVLREDVGKMGGTTGRVLELTADRADDGWRGDGGSDVLGGVIEFLRGAGILDWTGGRDPVTSDFLGDGLLDLDRGVVVGVTNSVLGRQLRALGMVVGPANVAIASRNCFSVSDTVLASFLSISLSILSG